MFIHISFFSYFLFFIISILLTFYITFWW
jgi:hypothetical protein